ncbi:MMPL family transporter [Phycicoccus sp. CSK15P-2]|uniref:MMPL family transporter n=1 Tax=Phycicoccus sp. CSK15P-2 TaxID=2807627 RepID=UPI00194FA69D|nr:MMPL family transporter [Phycicoccus sp. CSK15P-2]MBM6405354.1 MMPL family transporter [Phycicoccus sp. CSK15P-2]
MSTALYRLGRWCSAHAWPVIAAWLVVLAVAGTLAGTIGRPLTSQVKIPNTDFEAVLDQLSEEIPGAAGGFGRVVLSSGDRPFTDEQKAAVEEVLAEWETVPHVERVVDPFAAQEQIDSSDADLRDAGAKLDDGRAQLEEGRAQLAAGKDQLRAGEALLAEAEGADPDSPGTADLRRQVEQGRTQLEDAARQLEDAEAQLKTGEQQYSDGRTVAQASSGTRLVSEDGRTAVVQVQFDDNAQSIAPEDRAQVPERGDAAFEAAGITPAYSVEITQALEFIGPGEILGLAVALLVLVLVLGSLVAAGLPLLVALLGVGVGLGGAMAFTAVVELNSTTPALALMLGLAVGIDYALFIVNRHRANILRGMDVRESIARADATAGGAVTFAGTTVVIALGALVLSGLPILAQMGLVAAATVAVAVLVAVTISPAVLRLMGTRVVSKRGWRKAGFTTPGDASSLDGPPHATEEHGRWYVRAVTGHPWLTVAGVVGFVAVLAVPVADMRLGLPDGGSEPTGSSAHTAYVTVADEFGPGMNGPIVAVAELPDAGAQRDDAEVLHEQARIVTTLAAVDGVESVVPFGVSDDTDTLAFQIVPSTGPAAEETTGTVARLHSAADLVERHDGTAVGLTGQTVANIEISQKLADALPRYLVVVVGLSLVILMLVFRSLVVPLVATGGFLLSVAAAFGATVAVHQWGWLGQYLGVTQPGPLLSFMPIIVIGVLFGLAMDYQMFLVSGMHESRAHGEESRAAVRSGFVHGARVVTAAAIIMTSVFLGFAFSHLVMVRPIGFGLAVGVLIDAFVVRMTLTPAIMHLLGDRAWWIPRWLDRVLPDLDIEGVELADRLAAEDRARRGVAGADATPTPAAPETVSAAGR